MSTHTPGPWNEGRPDMQTIVDGYGSKWIYAGNKYVAVASGRDVEDWDEVMANARLIAAAPDLLAACKLVLQRWTFSEDQIHTHTWHDMQDCREVLLAAVAKAEGEK